MRTTIETWLTQHCEILHSTVLGSVLLRRGSGLQPMAVWPQQSRVPGSLANAAMSAVAGRRRVVAKGKHEESGRRFEVVADPLEASGVLIGAVVVVLPFDENRDASVLAKLAASSARFGELLSPPKSGPEPAQAAANQETDAAAVLQIAHSAFSQPDFRTAATAVLTALKASLHCDRASLGFRSRGLTRVEATSDGSVVNLDRGSFSVVAASIAAAMDEAIDDAATLVYPQPPEAAPRIVAAHTHLVRQQGLQAVASVPLVHRGRVIGAILLERSDGEFDALALRLLEQVSRTVSPWLAAQRRAVMPWSVRMSTMARRWREALSQQGKGRYKLAALAAAAGIATLLLLPVRHEVTASARLEGTTQRVMAAPSDGYLKQVFVRPGDVVQAGQLLLEFEGEDLQLERKRLAAELTGEEATLGEAMSKQDRAQLAVASAKVNELQAQLDLIDQRITRSRVSAPFDGIVIQGDLSQALGAPVRKGDPLITLAPAQGFRAIVEVPDADVGEVRLGQNGSLVLTAHPDSTLPLTVSRITPLAVQVDGRNVFEIEVAVHARGPAAELRPGMRGVARLATTDKPLAVAWSGDALAWLRLATWRWLG